MDEYNELKEVLYKRKADCLKLIELGIWDGIDSCRLTAWLKNFKSCEEIKFAIHILEWFVFRSEKHMISMFYDLLTRKLHNQWRIDNNPLYREEENPFDLLSKKWAQNEIRCVTTVTEQDPPTKSGYYIASLISHKLPVNSKWIIRDNQIQQEYNKGIRTFVYLDDLSGSGSHIKDVLTEANVDQYSEAHFYICVCAAHQKAVEYINSIFPKVKVLCAEYIPYDANFFKNVFKPMGFATIDDCRKWYNDFMRAHNNNDCWGRGDLGLLYAFHSNVPNNSLPIIYWEQEDFPNFLTKRR